MSDGDNWRSLEATLCGAFEMVVNERLPAAARDSEWPISTTC